MQNLFKFKVSLLSTILAFLVISFLGLNLIATYSGTYHGSLMNTWPFTAGQFPYTNDVFLQNNIFSKTSIIFGLFSFLKINMSNDFIGFQVHTFLSLISGVFLFKIVKEFANIKNINIIIIIIFSIIAIDGKYFLVDANYSSWMIRHTGTTSHIGHASIFIFFWALLKEKNITLFFLTPVMLLISVKSTFFSIGIGIIYSLFFYKSFKKKFWIISPIVTILYMLSINVHSEIYDFETRKILFDHLISREGNEASFHLQPIIKIFLFILSFPVFFLLAKKLESKKLKNLFITTLVCTVGCFIWGFFYHKYGGNIWPQPKVAALGPTRAVEVYELFFAIILAIYIYKINFPAILKIGLYCCLYYIPYGEKGVFLSLIIICSLIVIFLILKNSKFKSLNKIFLSEEKSFGPLSAIIFFLLIFPSVIYTISTKQFDMYSMKKINKWKTGPLHGKHNRIDSAVLLQKCEDFILFDPDGKNWTNVIAGKSQYFDFTRLGINLFSIKLYNISKERDQIYEDIMSSLQNNKAISVSSENKLIKDNVVLLVNKKESSLFSSKIKKIDLKNGDFLILFLNMEKENLFYNDCLKRLR